MAKSAKKLALENGFPNYEMPDVSDYVVVELKYEAPVTFGPASFAAPAAGEPAATNLNSILGKFEIQELRPSFDLSQAEIDKRQTSAAALPPAATSKFLSKKGLGSEFIHCGFVQVVPKSSKDASKLATALKKSNSVWNAYVAPRPVPASVNGSLAGSRNFEPAQGYLHSPPNGIGAMEVWNLPGGKGEGVRICDIEGAWNLNHEDLPHGIELIGGTMIDELGWRDHGTAVLGEMVSQPNTFGTVGISHKADVVVHSAFVNNVFNAAGAITSAASKLKAGDVILIELQARSPLTNNYIAMQYWAAEFSAIVAATQKGITVVQAAGNGNEDFDQAIYANSFLQQDSGAIVVGAGVPPTNFFDSDGFGAAHPAYSEIGVPRSRIFFSNYGKIVNVQGWGWHVSTLAYGDAQGGASENQWYTHRFSGTSSASPIVAASAACIQGRAKKVKGTPLSPAEVRKLLVSTGTRQEAGPGVPVTQKIGPQPNLSKALAKIV